MSRVLVDTQLLLWSLYSHNRVPGAVAHIVSDRRNEVLFSAASTWEIAIKKALGKPDFVVDPTDVISDAAVLGLAELPVTAAAAAQVASLPAIHKDPFDRLLVAQAISEATRLYTADRLLAAYSPLVEVFDPV
jgi:PIN domain nuclease of toxin-antitoxin system